MPKAESSVPRAAIKETFQFLFKVVTFRLRPRGRGPPQPTPPGAWWGDIFMGALPCRNVTADQQHVNSSDTRGTGYRGRRRCGRCVMFRAKTGTGSWAFRARSAAG